MAGIVKSNKVRRLIGNRLKEIDVPTATLDTALYYADLTAQGASFTQSRVNTELNAYPTTVKNNASLVLTPSANKAGIVYAMNGDSKTLEEFEFQRGSSGTYFDASGVMQLAEHNVPRINFENGVSKGLLIEPASSNLFTDSGIVDGLDSFPSKSSSGLTAVDTNFNLGVLLSKGVRFSNESTGSHAYKQVMISDDKTYTISAFVKMDDNSQPSIMDFAFVKRGAAVRFNNQNVINCGNNVYRVFVEFTVSSGLSYSFGIVKYTTDSNKSFVASGLQLEVGSLLTSYIPTTSAVATRLADKVLSKRPTAVFNKNSINVKTAELQSRWFGNGVSDIQIPQRNLLLASRFTEQFSGRRYIRLSSKLVENLTYTLHFHIKLINGNAPARIMFKLYKVPLGSSSERYTGYITDSINNNFNQISISFTVNESMLDTEYLAIFSAENTPNSDLVTVSVTNPKLEQGTNITNWEPAPEDYIKVDDNGNIEISHYEPIHVQQFSLISRELNQEEV